MELFFAVYFTCSLIIMGYLYYSVRKEKELNIFIGMQKEKLQKEVSSLTTTNMVLQTQLDTYTFTPKEVKIPPQTYEGNSASMAYSGTVLDLLMKRPPKKKPSPWDKAGEEPI